MGTDAHMIVPWYWKDILFMDVGGILCCNECILCHILRSRCWTKAFRDFFKLRGLSPLITINQRYRRCYSRHTKSTLKVPSCSIKTSQRELAKCTCIFHKLKCLLDLKFNYPPPAFSWTCCVCKECCWFLSQVCLAFPTQFIIQEGHSVPIMHLLLFSVFSYFLWVSQSNTFYNRCSIWNNSMYYMK